MFLFMPTKKRRRIDSYNVLMHANWKPVGSTQTVIFVKETKKNGHLARCTMKNCVYNRKPLLSLHRRFLCVESGRKSHFDSHTWSSYMVEEKREETRFVQRTSGLSCQTLTPEHHQQTHRRDMHHHITLSTDISVKLPSDHKRPSQERVYHPPRVAEFHEPSPRR
jgi:hypothetical protein